MTEFSVKAYGEDFHKTALFVIDLMAKLLEIHVGEGENRELDKLAQQLKSRGATVAVSAEDAIVKLPRLLFYKVRVTGSRTDWCLPQIVGHVIRLPEVRMVIINLRNTRRDERDSGTQPDNLLRRQREILVGLGGESRENIRKVRFYPKSIKTR